MKDDQFEIRLYPGRVEVHYGEQAPPGWTPEWAHVFTIPGGTFADAVAEVRSLAPAAGTGTFTRYAHMSAGEARGRGRFDVADAGGGEVPVNRYRVQLRPAREV